MWRHITVFISVFAIAKKKETAHKFDDSTEYTEVSTLSVAAHLK